MKPYLVSTVLFLACFTAIGYFGSKDVILTAYAILFLLAFAGDFVLSRSSSEK